MRVIRSGTSVSVLTDGRFRHCIVTTVNDQDTIDVRLAREPLSATRETATNRTRGEQFEESE